MAARSVGGGLALRTEPSERRRGAPTHGALGSSLRLPAHADLACGCHNAGKSRILCRCCENEQPCVRTFGMCALRTET
eukprot:10569338-Alexandrium_andersonii.AAC.1